MRRIITAPVIFVLLFTSASGQTDKLPQKTFWAVKADVVSALRNRIGLYGGALLVERGFAGRHSIQFTSGYHGYSRYMVNSRTITFIPEYKYYLSRKQNFKGFYTGFYFNTANQISNYTCLTKTGDGMATVTVLYGLYGAGFTFGFQTYIKKHFTIDILLGLGGRYSMVQAFIPSNVNFGFLHPVRSNPFENVDRRIGINLGYKF